MQGKKLPDGTHTIAADNGEGSSSTIKVSENGTVMVDAMGIRREWVPELKSYVVGDWVIRFTGVPDRWTSILLLGETEIATTGSIVLGT